MKHVLTCKIEEEKKVQKDHEISGTYNGNLNKRFITSLPTMCNHYHPNSKKPLLYPGFFGQTLAIVMMCKGTLVWGFFVIKNTPWLNYKIRTCFSSFNKLNPRNSNQRYFQEAG